MGKKVAYKSKDKMEPADWQEAHHPTEAVTVRLTGSRRKETARRRTSAVRLFDGMPEDYQQAMVEINDAFNLITRRVNSNISMYEDYVPGTGAGYSRGETIRALYMEWAGGKLFSHGAAMDVIAYGKTISEVYRNRRWKSWYMVKKNLNIALHEWCILRGWRRRTY